MHLLYPSKFCIIIVSNFSNRPHTYHWHGRRYGLLLIQEFPLQIIQEKCTLIKLLKFLGSYPDIVMDNCVWMVGCILPFGLPICGLAFGKKLFKIYFYRCFSIKGTWPYSQNFLQSRVGNDLDFVARSLDIFFRPTTLTRELLFFLF